jgi:hypothetical protein
MSDPITELVDRDTPVLAAKEGRSVYHIPKNAENPIEMACGQCFRRVGVKSLSILLRTSDTKLCDKCWPGDVDGYPVDARFKRIL